MCVHLQLVMLLGVLMLAVGSSAALAKASPPTGVHIDPGSPVAKEYAIPLQSARGGSGSGGSGGQLFGSGITHAQSASQSASHAVAPPTGASTPAAATSTTPAPLPARVAAPVTRVHARAHRRGHRSALPAPSAPEHPVTQVVATPAAQFSGAVRPAGAGTGIAWMLGAAALVLALGGIGSAALARYGRRTSARTS